MSESITELKETNSVLSVIAEELGNIVRELSSIEKKLDQIRLEIYVK